MKKSSALGYSVNWHLCNVAINKSVYLFSHSCIALQPKNTSSENRGHGFLNPCLCSKMWDSTFTTTLCINPLWNEESFCKQPCSKVFVDSLCLNLLQWELSPQDVSHN